MFKKLIALAAVVATPVFSEPVTVETYRGPVEVQKSPEKIAVFDVSALDSLAALGVIPGAVVENVFVDYLDASTKDAEIIGTLHEPDYEALAAFAPDLVIAGGRSYKVVPDLQKIAPTVDMTIWEDSVAQGLDRLEAFGQIFGKEAEAAALTAAFNEQLEATKAVAEGKGKALIVMTVGPKISAYGASGRFGWLHKALGLEEAVEEVEQATHGEAISFEFIRDANPDILIVVDRLAAIGSEGEAAATTLDNALVHETNAWKNDKVIYIESAPLYVAGGGIQSMSKTLDQIATALADN